jgi:hypothetical protein
MLVRLKNDLTEIVNKQQLSINDIKSIGIGCGGPPDSIKGIIMLPRFRWLQITYIKTRTYDN